MTSKKPKTILKTEINSKQKTTRAYIYILKTLKVKKHKIKFLHQIKPFDIKTSPFGGLNRCQQYFSLPATGIR
jgi:hypothetical protein